MPRKAPALLSAAAAAVACAPAIPLLPLGTSLALPAGLPRPVLADANCNGTEASIWDCKVLQCRQ